MQLEEKIISNLMFNEEFANKVIPFAKKEYFGAENGFIVDEIVSFYKEYGKVPSKDEIKIDLSNNRTISDKILKKIYETVDKIDVDVSDPEWLVKNTEKMFKDKALVNAIMQGATILEQGGKDNSKILGLVEDALSVTFDTNIGHDYFSDIQKRFESYHTVEDKVSWGLTTMDNITNGGISKKNIACAVAPTGCHAKGSKILMSDGSFKNVEDIRIGDRLIGYNGQFRTVLNLCRGREIMYRITPNRNRAKPFVVNGEHILALHDSVKNTIDCISVNEYLKKSKTYKHIHHLYLNNLPLDFESTHELKIDPYFMGIYLGDGHTHCCAITTMDEEVQDYALKYVLSKFENMKITSYYKESAKCRSYRFVMDKHGIPNKLSEAFSEYGIMITNRDCRTTCAEKFIPEEYLTADVSSRLELLAGLIDTDGYLSSTKSNYEFSSKSIRLANDVQRLARGLGFVTNLREKVVNGTSYYRLSIIGDLCLIPCKVERKKSNHIATMHKDEHYCGFTVEQLEEDDYYGFTLDGDHLYYNDDCVLNHNSGKTAFLCSIVSNAIRHGYNVLYISMEMSEQKIAERIDANLMNETIPNIYKMNLNQYTSKVNQLKERVKGTLKIKEYPTSGANVSHFKALMNELKLKQHFVPDLVVVDYLNICNSARVKAGQTNSYGYIKAISEELRGLAVEYNVALLTATQTNRNGFNNSDVEMTDISESIGMTHVMDFIFAIIRTEALDQVHQISIKQLKNRYSDPNQNSTVFLGIDFSRMKLYDLEGSANGTNAEFFRPEYRLVEKTAPMSYEAPSPMTQINDFSSFQF